MTREEKNLIKKLNNKELDGYVGDEFYTKGGSMIWMTIIDGIITRKKQGPTAKFFNGKETEKVPGKMHILEKWESDNERVEFLQKFGWLINDEMVRAYSAKYKPSK